MGYETNTSYGQNITGYSGRTSYLARDAFSRQGFERESLGRELIGTGERYERHLGQSELIEMIKKGSGYTIVAPPRMPYKESEENQKGRSLAATPKITFAQLGRQMAASLSGYRN
jgi:hypothetical protein